MHKGRDVGFERLSLEFSLAAWQALGSVKDWSRCRVGDSDAFVVSFRTSFGEIMVTILQRGDRWCVCEMPGRILIEDRLANVVTALGRTLVDDAPGERAITLH